MAWVKSRYPATTESGRRRRNQIGLGLRMAALGFLLAYPLMMFWFLGTQGSIKWIDNFGIQILIYVMLGWGLNIVVGLAGLLDLGYVAFYAVGAYSFALLAKNGLPFIAFVPEYPFLAVDFYQLGLWRSGCCCRSPACWRRSGASCSDSRCCGCAATISRSSRSPSARSSAWC